jgi:hypothetical protein
MKKEQTDRRIENSTQYLSFCTKHEHTYLDRHKTQRNLQLDKSNISFSYVNVVVTINLEINNCVTSNYMYPIH